MMVYNFIFYRSFKLNIRSRNFNSTPIIAGLTWVVPSLILNLLTHYTVLSIVFKLDDIVYSRPVSFALGAVTCVLLFIYYKKRFKRIIEKYKEKSSGEPSRILSSLIVFGFFAFSFFIIDGCHDV